MSEYTEGYIPVEEQLPTYGERVLLLTQRKDWAKSELHTTIGFRKFTDTDGEHYIDLVRGSNSEVSGYSHKVVGWMPLPPRKFRQKRLSIPEQIKLAKQLASTE